MKFWQYLFVNGLCIGNFLFAKEPFVPVEDACKTPILTPCFKDRETLKLKLANGLEVFIVSDPESPEAGAVLSVGAGSWNDPEEFPGLAHFLEHMLFLGTHSYPIESDYHRFIREHDGNFNAYTTTDHTLYLFSISPTAFSEALDRFSGFFKEPLFNPSGVSRELNAVDQEFAKNIIQDSSRKHHVTKELAEPSHPYRRFSHGNLKTLSKVSREDLIAWYETNYSADRMKLILYGPEPINFLKEAAIKNFSGIPVRKTVAASFPNTTLHASTPGNIVYIESIKNQRVLTLTWEMPRKFSSEDSSNPEYLIASVLGHEGEGSLLASLKQDKLVESLSSGGGHLSKDHLLFSLSIQLTEEGLEQLERVIERCFQAIRMLKDREIPDYLFEETKKTLLLRYQYQSRSDLFEHLMTIGNLFVYENLETFPEKALLPEKFDRKEIKEFVDHLSPRTASITVLVKHSDLVFDRKEKWMEVSYAVVPISQENLKKWESIESNPEIRIPTPNPFIADKLLLIDPPADSTEKPKRLPVPSLLIDTDKAKIYHAQDFYFRIPKTKWYLEIKTPSVNADDPLKVAMTDLYVKCLKDALNPFIYPAQLADVSYKISQKANGISLAVIGYHESAETLFKTISTRLKNCLPSERQFRLFKESLLRRYHNFQEESPLKTGLETYEDILYESYATSRQCAKALETVSFEDFQNHHDHLFDFTFIEGLFYGNVDSEQSRSVYRQLEGELKSSHYPEEERLVERVVVLSDELGPLMVETSSETPSNATLLAIEEPYFSFKNRAAQQILSQALSTSFYTELRTQQQTGYIVFCSEKEIKQHLFFLFGVQSATHDPRDLLARFELFLEVFLRDMDNKELTPECFENIRRSLIHFMEHSPQNLNDAGALLKTLIFDYDCDFDWLGKRIQGLKELEYEEFLEFTRRFLGRENKRRLAVTVSGSPDNDLRYLTLPNALDVKKTSRYAAEVGNVVDNMN